MAKHMFTVMMEIGFDDDNGDIDVPEIDDIQSELENRMPSLLDAMDFDRKVRIRVI